MTRLFFSIAVGIRLTLESTTHIGDTIRLQGDNTTTALVDYDNGLQKLLAKHPPQI
jgi:hypothetical protein